MPVSKLSLDFQGLVTAPGKLQAPAGALQKATNINFLAPGYAEKRRGIQRMTTYMGEVGWKVVNSPLLNANILANIGNSVGASTLKVGNGTGAWTTINTPDLTSFSNTPSDRMRATVLLQNHYLTSARASGRYGNLGTFGFGGMPLPLGFHYESLSPVLNAGTAGTAPYWLLDGYACAYRVVWVLLDDAGAEIQSAPSGRLVIQNASGTPGWSGSKSATVNLRILVPYQSDTGSTPIPALTWTYRVYRSKQRQISTGQPDDEMQLVYQGMATSSEITAGYIDLVDSTPEAAMDGALYTNETVGRESGLDLAPGGDAVGLAGSNWRPPLAKEVAAWSDCVFWGNFKTPQRITFSILAVGSTGVQAGSVFNFYKQGASAFSLTGSAAGAAPNSTTFLVQTGWTSIAANIRDTAINLCAAINALRANTWLTATYIGSDASPGTIGQILLEARRSDLAPSGGNPAFEVAYAPVASENPFLPPMALESSCDTWTNGVAFSRRFQGDSVPLVNYTRIGRNDAEVLAMVPLRDALFIFTTHGLYWVRGTFPNDFRVEEFDLTFRLLGRELVVACEDALYAWGQEGIAKITNGGVQFIDLPIRNLVQQAIYGLDSEVGATLQGQAGFAVSYRVERRVLFFFKGGTEYASDKTTLDAYGCQYALCFNLATGAWSQYDLGKYVGKCTGVVRYSDETLVASEWDGIPGGAAYLYQESKTNTTADWYDKDRTGVSRPITTTLEWTTFSPDPSALCHWRETQVYFNTNEYISTFALPSSVTLKVETEFTDANGAPQTTTWAPNSQQNRVLMEPAVGMATRMVLTLTHNVSGNYFNLGGWALLYSVASTFNTR